MLEQIEVVDKVGRIFVKNSPDEYNLEKILEYTKNCDL